MTVNNTIGRSLGINAVEAVENGTRLAHSLSPTVHIREAAEALHRFHRSTTATTEFIVSNLKTWSDSFGG